MAFPNENVCPTPEALRDHIGTVFFLTLLFLLAFLSRFIFAPLMPFMEKDLGMSHTQAGSLFFMLSLGFLTAQIASGFVSAQIRHRGALTVSAIAVGLALIPFSFSGSLGLVRLLMILLGMASGLHLPSALATITAMVEQREWGKALGIHQTAPSIALVVGPLLVVIWPLSWRVLLLLLGFVSFTAGLLFPLSIRSGDFPGEAPGRSVMTKLLRLRSFWIMVALFGAAIACGAGLYTMLPLYLVAERGFDPNRANFMVGLSRISGLFVTLLAGWVSDRLGEKRTITGVLFLSGAATIFLSLAPRGWFLLVLFIQPALTVSFFPPAFAALSRIVPPNFRSVTSSLTTPFGFLLGGGLVPMFLGYMGETLGFGMGIALVGIANILIAFLALSLGLRDQVEEGC
jgi:NNP family nitrate/nitrite transporter-like MFS transporter